MTTLGTHYRKRRAQRNSRTKILGVSLHRKQVWRKGKWTVRRYARAQYTVEGKRVSREFTITRARPKEQALQEARITREIAVLGR